MRKLIKHLIRNPMIFAAAGLFFASTLVRSEPQEKEFFWYFPKAKGGSFSLKFSDLERRCRWGAGMEMRCSILTVRSIPNTEPGISEGEEFECREREVLTNCWSPGTGSVEDSDSFLRLRGCSFSDARIISLPVTDKSSKQKNPADDLCLLQSGN